METRGGRQGGRVGEWVAGRHEETAREREGELGLMASF